MTATKYFIIITLCIIVGWDVVAFAHGGYEATISWIIYTKSKEYPTVAFAFGYLCGHLFGSQNHPA